MVAKRDAHVAELKLENEALEARLGEALRQSMLLKRLLRTAEKEQQDAREGRAASPA